MIIPGAKAHALNARLHHVALDSASAELNCRDKTALVSPHELEQISPSTHLPPVPGSKLDLEAKSPQHAQLYP